jgi:hypothetical protein
MIELKSEYFSFVVHKARGRWTSVFRSFLIMATSSAIYLFPIYSNNIKRNLVYNQSMLSTLRTWNDIGSNIGILSGNITELTATRIMLVVSSVTNFLGYLMIWLAITKKTHKPEFCLVSLHVHWNQWLNFATTASFLCQEFFKEAIYDVGSFEKLCRT